MYLITGWRVGEDRAGDHVEHTRHGSVPRQQLQTTGGGLPWHNKVSVSPTPYPSKFLYWR